MNRFDTMVLGILVMTAQTVVIPDEVEAQLGKINRKYATVTVSPEVVTQGHSFFVTVHPWEEVGSWWLQVLQEDVLIAGKTFTSTKPVMQHEFTLPEDVEGVLTVRLMGKVDGNRYRLMKSDEDHWSILQEKQVERIPDFYQEVQTVYSELLEYEFSGGKIKSFYVYTAMAYAEDLLERIKSAEAGQGRSLKNRLAELKEMTAKVKENKDPYEGKTGYQLRGYRSMETYEIQPFSVYVPKDYDPSKQYPLVIMLHGAWSNHHLALRRVMGKTNRRGENDAAAKRTMPELPDVPYLVLAPNGYETMGYAGIAEDDIWFTFTQMAIHFSLDPNRVYLTGLSMGGGGTGRLGIQYPSRFAAIAPVCGYFTSRVRGDMDTLPDFLKRLYALKSPVNMAENLLNVPVKLMHGDADPVVPPQGSRDLHAKLREMGSHSELEMYPGVDHDAWTPAYKDARIFDWFSQFERDPYPKRVRYKTASGGGAYWVSISRLNTIREFASIEAEVKEDGIHIQTDNVEIFSLSLRDELLALDQEHRLWIDDSSPLAFSPGDYLNQEKDRAWFYVISTDGKWAIRKAFPGESRRRPTLNGLMEPSVGTHVYVYSTNGSEAETQELRETAQEMAFWGDMTDVRWQVLPEEDLTEEGSHHLRGYFLFSKINSSSYIQKNMANLPIKVKGEKIHFGDRVVEKDQGLMFVYPHSDKDLGWYITFCTATTQAGLEGIKAIARQDFSFSGSTYGDFICVDQNGRPLWGGLFDKDWNIETIEAY